MLLSRFIHLYDKTPAADIKPTCYITIHIYYKIQTNLLNCACAHIASAVILNSFMTTPFNIGHQLLASLSHYEK